jgi:prophage antirepressor-like protein
MNQNQVVKIGENHALTKPLMSTFAFEGHDVRVVMIDGKPHMVGKDVCEVLGYANHNNAMTDHCRGVAIRYPIADSRGRMQETRVLSEGDMFRLITHSTLPAAERFERLVFDEILPCIHKHGRYPAPSVALAAPADLLTQVQLLAQQSQALLGVVKQQIEMSREQAQQRADINELREAHVRASNMQSRAPYSEAPAGTESMAQIKQRYNKGPEGLPEWVPEAVIRQLGGFTLKATCLVTGGKRSDGSCVTRADGSVPNCASYPVWQRGQVTTQMNRFLSQCKRHPTDKRKAVHPALLDRPFNLAYGYAEGEKRDAREAAEQPNAMR